MLLEMLEPEEIISDERLCTSLAQPTTLVKPLGKAIRIEDENLVGQTREMVELVNLMTFQE